MPRVLVVGNSISAQRSGYVTILSEALTDGAGEFDVVNASLGGVGSIGLLALADRLLPSAPVDGVIVETSASDAEGATPPGDLAWAMEELLIRLTSLEPAWIMALHLPRTDVGSREHQRVVDLQNAVFDEVGVTVVDLRDALGSESVTDGVHLNVRGAAEVGHVVAAAVRAIAGSRTRAFHRPATARLVPIRDACWSYDGGEEAAFRGIVPTLRLRPPERALFTGSADEPIAVVGVVGPSSGVVSLHGPSGHSSSQWRDRWCEVRRLQVVHVPAHLRDEPWVEVEPLEVDHAAVNAWGQPSTEVSRPAVAEIVGMLARERRSSTTIRDPEGMNR